jgi:hypothetical protein
MVRVFDLSPKLSGSLSPPMLTLPFIDQRRSTPVLYVQIPECSTKNGASI